MDFILFRMKWKKQEEINGILKLGKRMGNFANGSGKVGGQKSKIKSSPAAEAQRRRQKSKKNAEEVTYLKTGCDTGRKIVKREPCPGLLSALMRPWWFSTILLQIARPIPVPG